MSSGFAKEIAGTLQEIRDEYSRNIEAIEASGEGEARDIIVVRLGDRRFGIPAPLTREVLRIPRLIRVPRVSPQIMGVINLRGRIVAVTDLRLLLGLTASKELPPGSRLVVTETPDQTTALAVEAVEGMRTIRTEEIDSPGGVADGIPADATAGRLKEDNGEIVLLNLPKILEDHDFSTDR